MFFSNVIRRLINPPQDPEFLDESGHQERIRQMVWILSVARFLALAEIPLMAFLNPRWVGSPRGAMLVFSAGLLYTLFYVFAATHVRPVNTTRLHALDIAAGVLLLFLAARSSAVLMPIAFYTSWISWDLMSIRFRDVLPATFILSVAFLAAESIAVFRHDSASDIQAVLSFYYMRGIYAVGFAYIMYRVSALELDSHLENQRLHLRRRLHDDLGNTLCGLHYNIECLKLADPVKVSHYLKFLEAGYARATRTLARIVKGLDEPDVDIADAMKDIKNGLEEAGWRVNLDVSRLSTDISPEVAREIIGILKEAAANAVRHSGGRNLNIAVGSRRGRVVFSISDDGAGFAAETLRRRQEEGGKGIRGMTERAELLGSELRLDSAPGQGTSITLEARESKGRSIIGKILNIGEGNQGGFYNTLVRAKQLGTGIQLVRTALLPVALITDPAMIVITLVVLADTLVWSFFRRPIYHFLRKRPWLLVIEAALFSFLFYLTWSRQLPLMVVDTTNLFMVLAAYFLSGRRVIFLSLLVGAGIIAASLLAPPLPGLAGSRNEMILLNITSNIFFAISVGFFVKFINQLEGMQKDAVARTLARQREQLSAATHGQILSGIERLEREVLGLKNAMTPANDKLPRESIERLKSCSNDTKRRLRKILTFLDQPTLEPGGPDPW